MKTNRRVNPVESTRSPCQEDGRECVWFGIGIYKPALSPVGSFCEKFGETLGEKYILDNVLDKHQSGFG